MKEPAKLLFLLSNPAYGSERMFDVLRLVHALVKREGPNIRDHLARMRGNPHSESVGSRMERRPWRAKLDPVLPDWRLEWS